MTKRIHGARRTRTTIVYLYCLRAQSPGRPMPCSFAVTSEAILRRSASRLVRSGSGGRLDAHLDDGTRAILISKSASRTSAFVEAGSQSRRFLWRRCDGRIGPSRPRFGSAPRISRSAKCRAGRLASPALAMRRPRRPVPGVDALRAICERDAAQRVRSGGVAAFRSALRRRGHSQLIGVPRRGSATLGGWSAENVSPELPRR